MEQHIRALCKKHCNIPTVDDKGKSKKADILNAELWKASAYGGTEQEQVTAWLAHRNDAAHGNYDKYTKKQVALMIAGVRDFIASNPLEDGLSKGARQKWRSFRAS